jgi:hypothetical protein
VAIPDAKKLRRMDSRLRIVLKALLMILELLEWCLTPTSLRARTNGLLAEQIAIRHRANRCRSSWQSHLQSCKSFLNRKLSSGYHVAVLGSGHLHDIDLRYLKSNFSRITLIDVVHPLEVQIMAMFSSGRIGLRCSDLSGALHLRDPTLPITLDKNLRSLLESADALVSSCLLTQLALPTSHRWAKYFNSDLVDAGVARIQQNHIELLESAPKAILITDSARRYGNGKWSRLLSKVRLPTPAERWIWDIAPAEEHGLKNLGAEQRSVEAFFFSRHALNTKIFAHSC